MSVGRPSARRATAATAVAALVCLPLAACNSGDQSPVAAPGAGGRPAAQGDGPAARVAPVRVTTEVGPRRHAVPLTRPVRVRAEDGTLRSVTVTSAAGDLAGRLHQDRHTWTAVGRLEPGTAYTVRAVAVRADGRTRRTTSSFTTQALPLDRQTYPSVAPLDGETVGVGMPVIVTFDVAVSDQASIEKHLHVRSSPTQKGSWHWISDHEVHWRPADYWRPGTDVTVDADINSIPAGAGIFGQESRQVSFHVGDSVISKVDARAHQMRTFINGRLARTIPITTGKPGFTTRSGIKVIIEKFRTKRMNSETIGINPGDPEAYDLDDVEYALRVTYSGEFLHAAPWSVGSQGYANVSHGCTGLSTTDARWFYDHSKRGDVVDYTGTDRPMTLTNGYGDWNESFPAYASGSALH